MDEQQVLEVSLIENLQRENLNALEEAAAIRTLMDEHDLTQDEVAKRLKIPPRHCKCGSPAQSSGGIAGTCA